MEDGSGSEGLAAYFTGDHRRVDASWAEVEAAVDAGEAERVQNGWHRFDRALRRHLAMEEALLFPAFEAVTGMKGVGPTEVMRNEHAQMRAVLGLMDAAVARGDHRELLDQGDTLLMLIQQHNVKEEGMLYPMAERALADQWPELARKLDSFEGGS